MWLILASASSLLSGISIVLSKMAVKKADALVVNAITNTCIMIVFIISSVFLGVFYEISEIGFNSMIIIFVSAIIISFSWIFFFLGFAEGSVNINMAIDKSAIPITMLLSAIILNERITEQMVIGTLIIGIGTLLITVTKDELRINSNSKKSLWTFYAFMAAVFASMANVIIKLDHALIDTNLTSALRYIIVALFLWVVVIMKGRLKNVLLMDRKSMFYTITAGFIMGVSYSFFYKALSFGTASVVTVIFKMSFIISTLLACLMMGERLFMRGKVGVILLTVGIGLFLIHNKV